jgi:hypothetical protein
MSTKSIKLIAFIVLLVHGIGHLQGVVSSTGVKFTKSTSNISWLLKGLGEGLNRTFCLAFYMAAGILGIFAALSFYDLVFTEMSWQNFALTSAFFSTVSLILFPNALAMFFNKAGAIAINLIIFYSILFDGHWPAAIFND